jgi:uncharacterized membrane protein
MHVTGLLHFALAIAALMAGLAVTLARKGTALHRRLGWIYVGSMVGVNVTALVIYRLLGHFGPFHAAALFSLFTVLMGVVPARRKPHRWWLRQHAYWMGGSYIGLWAAAVAETATRTTLMPFWWMVVASSALVSLVGLVVLLRGVPRAIRGMKPGRGRSRRS